MRKGADPEAVAAVRLMAPQEGGMATWAAMVRALSVCLSARLVVLQREVWYCGC